MKKLKLSFIIIALVALISCENEEINKSNNTIEVSISNDLNSEITFTTIKTKVNITSQASNSITEKGVCWSKTTNPTKNDNFSETENSRNEILISNLNPNTVYFIRAYAITNNNTIVYSEVEEMRTLSLENTTWKFSTYYPPSSFSAGVTIESTVMFYADGTTKYDEIGAGQGLFITYGTWSLNDNTLTYIWEGDNPANSAYVYTGSLNGLAASGNFTHPSVPGTWTAIQL